MEIHDLKAVKSVKDKGRKVFKEFLLGVCSVVTLYASPSTLYAVAVTDGYIVRVDSATAYLDWGKTSGVQVGDTFDIYRAGPVLKHPVTGEVLGQTQDTVGQGVVETLDDKFSIGHILEKQTELKAGDRTRLKVSAPKAEAVPAVTAPPVTTGPQVIWQSSAMAGTPRSVAVGDVEGSGAHDVVVALADHLDVYRWQTDHLEKIATYNDRQETNWMTVEVADPASSGHPKIFATWYLENVDRARVAVIEWSSGTLKETSHFEGFARLFPRLDGSRPLLVQDFGLGRELRVSSPKLVIPANNKFKAGNAVALAHPLSDTQLFGYAWGDWDNDKSEDFAFLLDGERLRIFFKNKKWTADASYGGTKLSFSFGRSFDAVATIYPRLTPISANGKNLLLTYYNESTTGLHFTRIKSFHSGEMLALAWNGSDMAQVWRLPVSGYIADYAADCVSQAGQSELWVLTEVPGNKSVVTGYKL